MIESTLVAAGISLLGLAISYFGFIMQITNRLTAVETRNEVFWKVLEPHMAAIIHSPMHKNRDDLVDRLINKTITLEQAEELICLLEENIKENHNEGKQLASALLLARTKGLIRGGQLK